MEEEAQEERVRQQLSAKLRGETGLPPEVADNNQSPIDRRTTDSNTQTQKVAPGSTESKEIPRSSELKSRQININSGSKDPEAQDKSPSQENLIKSQA